MKFRIGWSMTLRSAFLSNALKHIWQQNAIRLNLKTNRNHWDLKIEGAHHNASDKET
jgi:hypothetical protein